MPPRIPALCIVATALAAAGCYSPGGSALSVTGEPQTYHSTELRPLTVALMNVRTGEVVFSLEVPAGKQFTVDFDADEGDDPVTSPDLMRWQVFDLGTRIGRLENAMTVPAANARRLDVRYRDSEARPAPPEAPLRTDELIDRPDWWTPEGGEMPDDSRGLTNYDG